MVSMRHIVHVGYHKTGSTWLQSQVFPHAQGVISTTDDKLAFHLIRDLTNSTRFRRQTFEAFVNEAPDRLLLSYEGIVGSPWNLGVSADERADRLVSVVPDADIVLVRRDPSELRWSLYVQWIQQGGVGTESDFEDEVLNRDYLDIEAGIDRFKKRFNRVHVLPYDVLRHSPAEFLTELGEAVDAEFPLPGRISLVNPSLHGWRLSVLRWWNRAFRKTTWHPDPWIPIPGAGLIRNVLQASQVAGLREVRRRYQARAARDVSDRL